MDTFAITIFFIVICTVVGAFIKGRTRDRCLNGFSGYPITIEGKDGKVVWGKLRVENSALELVYSEPYLDNKDNQVETSYILYKNEYDRISALIRYVDSLDARSLKLRMKDLKKMRHPRWYSRLIRKVRNVFGTVRDSLLEAVNLFVGRIKAATPAGKVLEGQDKYTSSLQQQLVTTAGTSYEPVLERYNGKKVVLALTKGDKKEEYAGILKDYTPDFISIMDVDYKSAESEAPRKADLVIPRSVAIVRHSGE